MGGGGGSRTTSWPRVIPSAAAAQPIGGRSAAVAAATRRGVHGGALFHWSICSVVRIFDSFSCTSLSSSAIFCSWSVDSFKACFAPGGRT